MRVLVTGATGFVGSRLIELLDLKKNYTPIAAIRKKEFELNAKVETFVTGNINEITFWGNALDKVDTVIHTAARVHVMNDSSTDPLSEFRKINVDGTLNLAKQAADSGVNRFIFISSIKVNGENTKFNKPFTENDLPSPVDAYGISKLETEIALYKLADKTGMEVVCIRPPLVYGPGVKANFLKMMSLLQHGVPLPLGAIKNKRSLVSLDNLIDLVITCIDHPNASNQTFLAGDGEDLSTTELLQRVSVVMGKSAYLLPVPQVMLEIIFNLFGKNNLKQRLCESLQVDISKAKNLLDWHPPLTIEQGLKKTVQYFNDVH